MALKLTLLLLLLLLLSSPLFMQRIHKKGSQILG
jgi:hypothetical protein